VRSWDDLSGVADWEEIMTRIRCEASARTLHDLIESRAYALWEREGKPEGSALHDWLQAEAGIWRHLTREWAHALCKQEGRPEGSARDHWLQTEAGLWRNLIRERAYELWEEEARPEGRALSHWLQAEAEIQAAQFANWPEHEADISAIAGQIGPKRQLSERR